MHGGMYSLRAITAHHVLLWAVAQRCFMKVWLEHKPSCNLWQVKVHVLPKRGTYHWDATLVNSCLDV
jgi:hypothetical protein